MSATPKGSARGTRPGASHSDSRTIRIVVTTAAFSAVAFGADAYAVSDHVSAPLDRHTELTIHQHLGGTFHSFMDLVSTIGGPTVLTVLAVVLALGLLLRRDVWAAALVALAPAGAAALETGLKHLFHRQRPHLWPHALVIHSYSFPSGHATISAALFAMLTFIGWRIGGRIAALFVAVISICIVGLIGLSRVYLGAHWPTDVLGGYLIGLLWTSVLITVRLARPRDRLN